MGKMKNDVFYRLLVGIHDSTGHDVHKIVIYNMVSHNFDFLSCFLDIIHFVGIYE